MKHLIEEFGFVIIGIICIAALVATVVIIRTHNNNMVKENYNEFTDKKKSEIGGKGLGDGDNGSAEGEGFAIPDSNKEEGNIKTPDVMW